MICKTEINAWSRLFSLQNRTITKLNCGSLKLKTNKSFLTYRKRESNRLKLPHAFYAFNLVSPFFVRKM
tara:strand:- start:241 stop:447 length:207 start_codon:yes stop_codon:yes gene_type:complete